ncbi:glycosyltransferase [Methylobacterium sp. DB0501]|uniref:glycosyltransferase n=2 Tax=Methylobacterium TaxID=407 RepID=UPI0013EA3239|nr:glycosyltransferase [Methylobacterium sp. DB0501]NGM34196.1 glycosyltransferase [Methylobacterium sp. DB0501]
MTPMFFYLIRDIVENDASLSSKYYLRKDLHDQYGFSSANSYFQFIMEFIIARQANMPRPPVIPDKFFAHISRKNSSEEINFLDLVADNIYKTYNGADRQARSNISISHLMNLRSIQSSRWLNKHDTSQSQAFARYIQNLSTEKFKNQISDGNFCSVCIAGFHRSVLGLGEDARRLADVLLALNYRVELIDFSSNLFPVSDEADIYEAFRVNRPTAPIIIFCMPLAEIARLWAFTYPNISAGRYVIAYSPWELSELPLGSHFILKHCDEVWCSTQYQYDMYAAICKEKAYLVPLYVRSADPQCSDFIKNLLSDKFNFLFAFDFNSRIERKNPLGLVWAFRCAFPQNNRDVQLVLKTINATSNLRALEDLNHAIGNDDRIIIIDRDLTSFEMAYLIRESDVFVSLHRAEGFGRLLAEAMLLRTLVICTDYSGSKDYAVPDTAVLTRYWLKSVEPHEYPSAIGEWAEPDLHHAAFLMNKTYSNPKIHADKIDAAHRLVFDKFGIKTVANIVKHRLDTIYDQKNYTKDK